LGKKAFSTPKREGKEGQPPLLKERGKRGRKGGCRRIFEKVYHSREEKKGSAH